MKKLCNINYVGMSIFQQNRLFRRYNSWTVQSVLLIHTNSICISTVSVACQIISSSFETFKNDHFSRKVIQYIIICRYIHRLGIYVSINMTFFFKVLKFKIHPTRMIGQIFFNFVSILIIAHHYWGFELKNNHLAWWRCIFW